MTIERLTDLFFPRLCPVCHARLQSSEKELCLHCQQHLPRTQFHRNNGNTMEQLFRGKAKIAKASAFFYSAPHSPYRHLLHHIKYHNGKECARFLGNLYAQELISDNYFSDIDLLVPVPLHPKRLHQRGYNQSEYIAAGIADVTQLPLDTHSLTRRHANPSQTHLARYERWLNTRDIFEVQTETDFSNKNLLLIDDIVTTGATLLACVEALQTAAPKSITLLTLSFAQ